MAGFQVTTEERSSYLYSMPMRFRRSAQRALKVIC